MTDSSAINPPVCSYCGQFHKFKCPLVKSIEYEKGMTKRVEFFAPADYPKLEAPTDNKKFWDFIGSVGR